MDSPVRKQQKRNDYLRHKMFRKINRRKKAERKQAIEAPMKELRKRLRRYSGGKKPDDDIVYETQNTEDGTIYRVHPSAFGAKELNVTTPNIVVKPDHDTRVAVDNFYKKLAQQSERQWYINPITGEQYMPQGGPLKAVYPEFDLITIGSFVPALRNNIAKVIQKAEHKNIQKAFNNLSDKQVDKLYLDALNENDIETAQLLRDLHFKKSSAGNKAVDLYGNPIKTYHTVGDEYNPNFNEFDPNIEGTNSSIYTSDNPYMSGTYSRRLLSENERDIIIEGIRQRTLRRLEHDPGYLSYDQKLRDKLYRTYTNEISARKKILEDHPWLAGKLDKNRQKQLYINLQNPVTVDNRGQYWNNIRLSELPKDVYENIRVDLRAGPLSNSYSTRSLEKAIKKTGGYDGFIVDNVRDYGPNKAVSNELYTPNSVYAVNNPNNLKLYNAVTYDDAGNIIPLSKRDNFNIKDMRYGIIPFLTIGTALSNYSNEFKNGKSSGIYIKPENRGKFTRLKKRTGKSASWFKAHGTPAQKKMATFALNAKKWKH